MDSSTNDDSFNSSAVHSDLLTDSIVSLANDSLLQKVLIDDHDLETEVQSVLCDLINKLDESPNASQTKMDTESDLPKEYMEALTSARVNRLEYLLKQSEIYSHFLQSGKKKPEVGVVRKAKGKRKPGRPRKQQIETTEESTSSSFVRLVSFSFLLLYYHSISSANQFIICF